MSKPEESPKARKARLARDSKAHKLRYAKIKKERTALETAAEQAEREQMDEKRSRERKRKAEKAEKATKSDKAEALKTNAGLLLPVLYHAKIDLAEAVKLRAEGRSVRELAERYGVTEQALSTAISKYTKAAREIDTFRNSRADILAGLQKMLLHSIDPKLIQKAGLQARILAAAVLYDKERLELDKSTANIAQIHQVIADIKQGKA